MFKQTFTAAATALLLSAPVSALDNSTHVHDASCRVVHMDDPIIERMAQENTSLKQSAQRQATLSREARNEDGLIQIDVAVFYRRSYAEAIGEQKVHEHVQAMFDEANRMMRMSHANIQFEPVFVRELWVQFEENEATFHTLNTDNELPLGDMETILPLISLGAQVDPDGMYGEYYLDHHVIAREYGASLFTWIQEGQDHDALNGPLGMSSMLHINSALVDQTTIPMWQEEYTYEQLLRSTAKTMAHEWGHNLGLDHEYREGLNQVEGTEPDNWAWSCGKGGVPGTATTIMWSWSNPGQPPRGFLANPEIYADGEACGDWDTANQTRVANAYAPIAASLEDRPAALGTVSFAQSHYLVMQGHQSIILTVERDGDLSQAAEIEVGLHDGTAVQGVDFEGSAGLVRFSPGQASAVVAFENLQTDSEYPRTFEASLRYPLRLDVSEDKGRALVEMQGSAGNVHLGNFSVEGFIMPHREQDKLLITREGNTEGEAVLYVSTRDGSAIGDIHYDSFNRTVRFEDGETEKVIPVYAYDVSGERDFYVDLSSDMNVSFIQNSARIVIREGERGVGVFGIDEGADLSHGCDLEVFTHCIVMRNGWAGSDNSEPLPVGTTEIPFTLERINGDTGRVEITLSLRHLYPGTETPTAAASRNILSDPNMLSWDGETPWDSHEKTFIFEDGETQKVVWLHVLDTPEIIYWENSNTNTQAIGNYGLELTVTFDGLNLNSEEGGFSRLARQYEEPTHAEVRVMACYDDGSATHPDCQGGNDDDDGDNGGNDDDTTVTPPPTPPADDNRSGGAVHPLVALFGLMGYLAMCVRRRKLICL